MQSQQQLPTLCRTNFRTLRSPPGRTLSRANIEQQKSSIRQSWRKIPTTPTRILISRSFLLQRNLHQGNLPKNITPARRRSARNQVRHSKDCCSDRKSCFKTKLSC